MEIMVVEGVIVVEEMGIITDQTGAVEVEAEVTTNRTVISNDDNEKYDKLTQVFIDLY